MNNLNAWPGHREAIRGLSFSPDDGRFATASDDATIRIWAFEESREERVLTGTLVLVPSDAERSDPIPRSRLGCQVCRVASDQRPARLWEQGQPDQVLGSPHWHSSLNAVSHSFDSTLKESTPSL